MEIDRLDARRRPGRKLVSDPNGLKGYAAGPRELVAGLRRLITARYGTMTAFHRALEEAGHRLSYKELSRQLSANRFPQGPDLRVVEVIVELCDPEQRSRIMALRDDALADLSAETADVESLPPPITDEPATEETTDSASQRALLHSGVNGRTWLVMVTVAALLIFAGAWGWTLLSDVATSTRSSGACVEKSGPVALAVSGRSASPAPAMPSRARSFLARSAGWPVTVVGIDGSPAVMHTGRFMRSADLGSLNEQHGKFLADVDGWVATVRAEEAEADVLTALDLAARAARGGTVVLMDSGLSTVEPMNYATPGLLRADVDDVVRFLGAEKAVPDLQGTTVVLVGIGDVASPQAPLEPSSRRSLVETWGAIAKAGGADCVEVVSFPQGGVAPVGVPQVRLVNVEPPAAFTPTPNTELVVPDGHATQFAPDTADFVDRIAAQAKLEPIARWLNADRARQARLIGTTARVGPADAQIELSLRRASAVAGVLRELGVEGDQLTVVGAGSDFAQYTPDVDPSGVLLPGQAALNRSVRIVLTGR